VGAGEFRPPKIGTFPRSHSTFHLARAERDHRVQRERSRRLDFFQIARSISGLGVVHVEIGSLRKSELGPEFLECAAGLPEIIIGQIADMRARKIDYQQFDGRDSWSYSSNETPDAPLPPRNTTLIASGFLRMLKQHATRWLPVFCGFRAR